MFVEGVVVTQLFSVLLLVSLEILGDILVVNLKLLTNWSQAGMILNQIPKLLEEQKGRTHKQTKL